jgi:hypothetical protein
MSEHKRKPKLGPDSWQWKAIEATQAHTSQLGAILLAALDMGRNKLPRFGRKAIITAEGAVVAPFITRASEFHAHAFVCSVADLIRNFRGLADHLKLSDTERTEMFTTVRRWCATDYRPGASGELFGG